MSKYRWLHMWMILPMLLMQLGIFRDYWGDFTENAWSVHVHYWTGTIWYLYLIIQPYLATHKQLASHRTNGIIGMFVAGGVCMTALAMLYRDIANAEAVAQNPQRFGPFKPWFFMGVAGVELVMITAFGFAIIMSIIRRKSLEDHAWWLISTVFIIMMPALGRGIQNVYLGMHNKEWPNVDIIFPIYITVGIIILLIFLGAWKYGKWKHPATWLAVGVNIVNFFLEPIGRSPMMDKILRTIITN